MKQLLENTIDIIDRTCTYCMSKWWGRLLSILVVPLSYAIIAILFIVIAPTIGFMQWIITGKKDVLNWLDQ